MTIQSIMKSAGGVGATRKLAKRRLNAATGDVNSLCGVVNDNPQLRAQTRQLQLAASLAEISACKSAAAKKKKEEMQATLTDKAPAALVKFMTKAGKKACGLTTKEMNSLLVVYFSSKAAAGLRTHMAQVGSCNTSMNSKYKDQSNR